MPAEIERTTYTIAEACGRIGIGERTYHRMQARGDGPPVIKIGGRTLIRRETLEEWLRVQETAR